MCWPHLIYFAKRLVKEYAIYVEQYLDDYWIFLSFGGVSIPAMPEVRYYERHTQGLAKILG